MVLPYVGTSCRQKVYSQGHRACKYRPLKLRVTVLCVTQQLGVEVARVSCSSHYGCSVLSMVGVGVYLWYRETL